MPRQKLAPRCHLNHWQPGTWKRIQRRFSHDLNRRLGRDIVLGATCRPETNSEGGRTRRIQQWTSKQTAPRRSWHGRLNIGGGEMRVQGSGGGTLSNILVTYGDIRWDTVTYGDI